MRVVSFLEEMEFEYEQSTGCLYLRDREDVRSLIGRGYSGQGTGLNNPTAETRVRVGPVPRGLWRMAAPVRHPALGPFAIRLSPETYKGARTGFLIHGDNKSADGTASWGCIIMPLRVRQFIADSGITRLMVV